MIKIKTLAPIIIFSLFPFHAHPKNMQDSLTELSTKLRGLSKNLQMLKNNLLLLNYNLELSSIKSKIEALEKKDSVNANEKISLVVFHNFAKDWPRSLVLDFLLFIKDKNSSKWLKAKENLVQEMIFHNFENYEFNNNTSEKQVLDRVKNRIYFLSILKEKGLTNKLTEVNEHGYHLLLLLCDSYKLFPENSLMPNLIQIFKILVQYKLQAMIIQQANDKHTVVSKILEKYLNAAIRTKMKTTDLINNLAEFLVVMKNFQLISNEEKLLEIITQKLQLYNQLRLGTNKELKNLYENFTNHAKIKGIFLEKNIKKYFQLKK